MKKYYVLFASAVMALASCTNETYLGTPEELAAAKGEQPISFGFDVPAATRATGAAAAEKLNNQFIVYGEKSESDGSAPVTDGSDAHQLVFRNYVVNYSSSSAYTTTSNTKDWEYVGQTPYASNVTPAAGETTQTIKYWDYGASNYVFTAVSALPADITAGRVSIAKTTSGSTVYDKGYVVTLAKTAGSPDVYPNLADLYFSDRNVINKSTDANRELSNTYGGNATLNFRNSLTQVRVGMYETIPGYDVSAISFKVTGDAAAVDGSSNPAFGAICPNVKADNFEGTITVTYYNGTDGPENTPKLTITPGTGLSNVDLILGTNINSISTSNLLGKSASAPTWDQVDGSGNGLYTSVLPQIANATNLKLKVNYTLYNSATGETITVESATAEVPAEYLQWKPNFKYTYLFKISDNTNGSSGTPGTDPAGLYPITFDAVVVEAEDGQAEYITTVSEPSITTFGVNSTTGKYVYGGSEYAVGSDIYATFVEGSTVMTPILGTSGAQHVNVYTVSSDDPTNFPVTEASVAEAIAKGPSSITGTIYTYNAGTDTYTAVANASDLVTGTSYYKTDANSVAPGGSGYIPTLAVAGTDYNIASVVKYAVYDTNLSLVTTVPTEDNKTVTLSGGSKALKMQSVAANTYAIEYEASDAWTGTYKKVYKVIKVAAAP